MHEQPSKKIILERVSEALPLVLTFLMPLFYLTTTTEFFEHNKLLLLIVGTVLMLVVLCIRILIGEKIKLVKSTVDLSLWAFMLVAGLATVFSVNQTASIYGGYGRWFSGLLAFIAMLGYFHFSTASFKSKATLKKGLYLLVGSVSFSTFIAMLSYFKIYLGKATYLRIPGFTLAGSTTTTAILAAMGVAVALGMLAYENNKKLSIGLVVMTIVNAMYVFLTGITQGWVVLVVGLVGLVMYVNLERFASKRAEMIALAGTIIAILFATLLPTTKKLLVNNSYPNELVLPMRESWVISSSIARDYPILGTGLSTFDLMFPRYRPMSLNNNDLWNTRFDKPYNELFNIMGSMGLVGLMASLFVVSRILKLVNASKKLRDDTGLVQIATVALVAVSASFLVTYATVLTTFVFLTILGYLVAAHALTSDTERLAESITVNFGSVAAVSTLGETKISSENYSKYIITIPVLLLTGYFCFLNYKNYMAEVYMRKALVSTANDGAKAYELQGKAINMNPQRDIYHTTYAQTNLALANILASKGDLTDADRQTIQTLIAQAIRSARIATEIVNPINVSNWETRAVVYRSLVNVANNAAEWAIRSYNNAIQLDPTNPRLRVNLGGIYYTAGDYLSAANQFRQATALKQDYANAYYNFAQALKQMNNYNNAIAALEITKNLVNKDSPDYKRVEREIADLKSSNDATAADNKPTVEEIAGTNIDDTPQDQEPLTNPDAGTDTGININQLPPREQNLQNNTDGNVNPEVLPEEPIPAPTE